MLLPTPILICHPLLAWSTRLPSITFALVLSAHVGWLPALSHNIRTPHHLGTSSPCAASRCCWPGPGLRVFSGLALGSGCDCGPGVLCSHGHGRPCGLLCRDAACSCVFSFYLCLCVCHGYGGIGCGCAHACRQGAQSIHPRLPMAVKPRYIRKQKTKSKWKIASPPKPPKKNKKQKCKNQECLASYKKKLIACGRVRCKRRVDSVAASPREYLERRAAKNVISPPKTPPKLLPQEKTMQKSRVSCKLQEEVDSVWQGTLQEKSA